MNKLASFVTCTLAFCMNIFCFAQNYQPPYFTDSAQRIEKIKATQAVIDRLYKEHAGKNNFPGFVYGVVADGKLIYTGATGYANVEKKIPAATSSAFRIASMSKSFTALAVLQLRDAGKLKLDDAVSMYIPEIKKSKLLTTDGPPITIRHLLTHAAGFPEDNPWGDRQLADTDNELMQLTSGVSFSNTPGVAYEYSNLGFALLGKIITKVSGQPYQQYINQKILQPLGMNNTYWEYAKVPQQQLAHGYRRANGVWEEEVLLHDGVYGAMGGIISTIEDYSKYMAMHMQAWPPRNEKEGLVLKRSSLREMHAPYNFAGLNSAFKYASGKACPTSAAYGFGLRWLTDCEGKTFVGHSGGLPGFGSNWNFLPEYGIGVVCFANVTYAPTGTFNLSILDTLVQMATLNKRVTRPSAILQKRKTELMALLPNWQSAGKYKIFAENFFADYNIADLQTQATKFFASAGSIVKVHDLVAENNLRGSFIIEAQNNNLQISFTLTPEANPLIQEYHLTEIKK